MEAPDWNQFEESERQYYEEEMKMGLMAKKPENDFEIAPQGNHVATCYQVIDLGFQESNWQGNISWKHKVFVNFELSNEKMQDGRPFSVGARYTLSLHEKAELRKALESWRGRGFTEQELEGFDLFNILDKPAMVNVQHNESNGNTYANISAITPLPKGMDVPKRENELIQYSLDDPDTNKDQLPNWCLEKINFEPRIVSSQKTPEADASIDFDDDIPF